MADVDMTDAPPADTSVAKTSKAGAAAADAGADGKKRFEVKKVRYFCDSCRQSTEVY